MSYLVFVTRTSFLSNADNGRFIVLEREREREAEVKENNESCRIGKLRLRLNCLQSDADINEYRNRSGVFLVAVSLFDAGHCHLVRDSVIYNIDMITE